MKPRHPALIPALLLIWLVAIRPSGLVALERTSPGVSERANGDVVLQDGTLVGKIDAGAFTSLPARLVVSNLGAFVSPHLINLQHLQTVGPDGGSVNFNRVSGITGTGVTGNLNSTLRLINTVQNGDPKSATNPEGRNQPGVWNGKPYEWGLGVIMNNGRTFKADGYAGQNGAAYFQGKKTAKNAGGTWAINAFAVDFPGLVNPTELTQAGEFDVHADGTDANGVRIGVSSLIKSTGTRDGAPSGYGEGTYGFTALADPGFGAVTSRIWLGKWTYGFKAAGPMEVAFDAADTSSGSSATPFVTTNGTRTISANANTPVAYRSAADQLWCFTKDKTFCLRADAGGTLQYAADPGVGGMRSVMQVDPHGNAAFGGRGQVLRLGGYTTHTIHNDGGSTAQRHHNGTVDMRSGVEVAGLGYFETKTAHPLVLRANSVEGARVTPAGRFATPSYTPPSSTSPCRIGETGWDTTFEYRCVATNTWKRSALTDF